MPSHTTYTTDTLILIAIDDKPFEVMVNSNQDVAIGMSDLNDILSQVGYTIAPIQPPSPQEELLPLHRRRHNS